MTPLEQKQIKREVERGVFRATPIPAHKQSLIINDLQYRVSVLEQGRVAAGSPSVDVQDRSSALEAQIAELAKAVSELTGKLEAQAKELESYKAVAASVEPVAKPKRKRRTKAEMEAARAAEKKAKDEKLEPPKPITAPGLEMD